MGNKMIRVKYVYFSSDIIFFLSIPVKSSRNIDLFRLYDLYTFPINIKNNSLKVIIDKDDALLAVGQKNRVNVKFEECFFHSCQYFCSPKSQYTDYTSDKS